MRRSLTRRRNAHVEDSERIQELFRIRLAPPLRVGSPLAAWVGRLDSKSKLRITWKVAFGPRGRVHEIACTVSRKSKKREVFLDGDLIHSGALGLLESVGGVAADTTLFEHRWELGGRSFCVCERVFVREGVPPSSTEVEDPGVAGAAREGARFELAIDGDLYHNLTDIDSMSLSQKNTMEEALAKSLAEPQESQPSRNEHTRNIERHVKSIEDGQLQSQAFDAIGTSTARHQQEHVRDAGLTEVKSARQPGVPRPNSPWRPPAETMTVLSDNGLAARVKCALGPGILGGKLSLTNDESGSSVLIGSASPEAVKCGIETGDVLMSLNGRMLPPRLDAAELMSLLRANPRYMLSDVVACLWRRRPNDIAGKHLTAHLAGLGLPLSFEIARIERNACSGISNSNQGDAEVSSMNYSEGAELTASIGKLAGYFVVIRSFRPHEELSVHCGDILVGLNHEPLPRFATATSVAQLVGDWAASGKLCANFWRLGDRIVVDTLVSCVVSSSKRSVLIASPSEVATAAANSGAGIWGTATTAVTVAGDGGMEELPLRADCQHDLDASLSTRKEQASEIEADDTSADKHAPSVSSGATNQQAQPVASKVNGVVGVVRTHGTVRNPEQNSTIPSMAAMFSTKTPIADDRNFAVFKRLLQSGATLDEIIAEMRVAGVPKETTQRIIESLRTLVAERAAKASQAEEKSSVNASVGRHSDGKHPASDPRSAMLAMIAKRQRDGKDELERPETNRSNSTTGTNKGSSDVDAALARYRKMVKLGVPAASVRQRMRLDQVESKIVRAFSSENGLEDDEQHDTGVAAREKTAGKRAKLHWDAMTLDDSALAVSVWAADAFGDDVDVSSAESRAGTSMPGGGGSGLLGDDDLERLATLFSDAENSSNKKQDEARKQIGDSALLTLNGRVISNARLFDPQRSQNVSITIAPLVRAHGGVDALACAIARMDTPRTSLEQLETLLAAMPTSVEKEAVNTHVCAPSAVSDSSEIARLDAAIAKDPRFSQSKSSAASAAMVHGDKSSIQSVDSDVLLNQPGCIADSFMHDVIVEREVARKGDSLAVASGELASRLRAGFVAENLAPAERFTYAVIRVERALSSLRNVHPIAHDTRQNIGKAHVSLSRRLEALITVLSAQPATEALAGKADSYLHAARSLVASRHLAKLLKHVLAAGNAVNAGSAKAGASAVRLSSLIQAARTKGADGKTSLLDGVVGLLLDRAARKHQHRALSQDHKSGIQTPSSNHTRNIPISRQTDTRLSEDASPQRRTLSSTDAFKDDVFLKDDLLDFPENDGLLASLDTVRGADERALRVEATKFAEILSSVVATEIRHALLELGPDAEDEEDPRILPGRSSRLSTLSPQGPTSGRKWQVRLDPLLATYLLPHGSSRQRRLAERDRLTQLETDAILRTQALIDDHVKPLEAAVDDLRKYFACDSNEPLDAIFGTLRDFLRAFCESRNAQRRHRRAEKREAERKAARAVDRSSRINPEQSKASDSDLPTDKSNDVISSAASTYLPKQVQAPQASTTKKQAKPPTYP